VYVVSMWRRERNLNPFGDMSECYDALNLDPFGAIRNVMTR